MRAVLVVIALVGACGAREQLEDSKKQLAQLEANKIAYELYPRWAIRGVDKTCPQLAELAEGAGVAVTELHDPWGAPFELRCEGTFAAVSRGPDGKPGTADDIVSQPAKQ